MGLMDKFKNLFTDEEYEEEEEIEEPVKIKEIKKEEPKQEENKLPTFMREKIEKEKEEQKKEQKNDSVSDFSINRDIINNMVSENKHTTPPEPKEKPINNNNFKFPIAFEESDFTDISRVSRQAMRSKKTLEKEAPVKSAPKQLKPKKET